MSEDARHFNNIETQTVIKYFYPPSKEIQAILTETVGEYATIVYHRQKLGGPV